MLHSSRCLHFTKILHHRELDEILQGFNYNIDHRIEGYNMRTVMMEAAFHRNTYACRALLTKKANPNARAKFGRTALHIAAINFSTDITKALIASKVSTCIVSEISKYMNNGACFLWYIAWVSVVVIG